MHGSSSRRSHAATTLLTLAGLAVCLALPTSAGAVVVADGAKKASVMPIANASGKALPRAQGSGDLTYHTGPVMPKSSVYAIFWAPSGYSFPAGYKQLIKKYFKDVAADSGKLKNVYSVGEQYGDSNGKTAKYKVSFGGAINDATPFPASGCTVSSGYTACLSDAQEVNEINAVRSTLGLGQGLKRMYFVFYPPGVQTCAEFGCSGGQYCAYHSYANSGSLIYANQPYVSFSGCDTGQAPNGNLADTTLNVISHEHNEAITDPHLDAWYDAAGYENGDKCNFDFGSALGSTSFGDYNQKINGGRYYLQREYSNLGHACLQHP